MLINLQSIGVSHQEWGDPSSIPVQQWSSLDDCRSIGMFSFQTRIFLNSMWNYWALNLRYLVYKSLCAIINLQMHGTPLFWMKVYTCHMLQSIEGCSKCFYYNSSVIYGLSNVHFIISYFILNSIHILLHFFVANLAAESWHPISISIFINNLVNLK